MALQTAPSRTAPLWHRLWRYGFFKRGFYEVLGLVLWSRSGQQMLNCGYAAPNEPPLGPAASEPDGRLGCQLYRRLVRDTPLAGRDVVEIGCGRGCGARFLALQHQPRSYLATDASHMLILGNRRRPAPGVRFATATAARLPVAPESCDVLIGVEAVHPLPDKAAVLTEAARVLRPGGRLLLADFFYLRETSANAAASFRLLAAESPLHLFAEEDWTGNAVAALEADSPRRLTRIARLPRLLRGPALSFAGTTESPLYRQLASGHARYLSFQFRKH